MFNWNGGNVSSKVVARGQSREHVQVRVEALKRKGYIPLMEIKEELGPRGRAYYVCVMENPKLKAKLEQRNNPSQ